MEGRKEYAGSSNIFSEEVERELSGGATCWILTPTLDASFRTQECWNFLEQEARECSEYLGKELDGTIAVGPSWLPI